MKTFTTLCLLAASLAAFAQDFDGARPTGSSTNGINLVNFYNTNIQLTAITHSGSHGILFNAYKAASGVSGSLGAVGNTKYASSFMDHGTGAGGIIFYGNGGNMDFLISPYSTGQHTNVVWGTPKMRIQRNGFVGIGTSSPSEKLEVVGNTKITNGSLRLNSTSSTDPYSSISFRHQDETKWLIDYGTGTTHNLRFLRFEGSASSQEINFDYANKEIEFLSSEVGIGTSSPISSLHVATNEDALSWNVTLNNTRNNSVVSNYGVGLKLKHSSNNETFKWGGIASVQESQWANISGLALYANEQEYVRIRGNGNVGIGTSSPSEKLEVAGTVYSQEVKVEVAAGTGPDYVFEPDYELRTLEETEAYIKENRHLPEVPSAEEMESNGVELGEMNMLLLKKIEELTLHQIELMKIVRQQQKEIETLKSN